MLLGSRTSSACSVRSPRRQNLWQSGEALCPVRSGRGNVKIAMSWRVTNGSGASHDRRVSRPRLAASAILTCAVVLSAAAGSPGAAALRANHVGTRDRVFRNHGVRLTYPTEWRAYTYADDASSFSAAVVYLSNRRLHEPCVIRTAARSRGRAVCRWAGSTRRPSWSPGARTGFLAGASRGQRGG